MEQGSTFEEVTKSYSATNQAVTQHETEQVEKETLKICQLEGAISDEIVKEATTVSGEVLEGIAMVTRAMKKRIAAVSRKPAAVSRKPWKRRRAAGKVEVISTTSRIVEVSSTTWRIEKCPATTTTITEDNAITLGRACKGVPVFAEVEKDAGIITRTLQIKGPMVSETDNVELGTASKTGKEDCVVGVLDIPSEVEISTNTSTSGAENEGINVVVEKHGTMTTDGGEKARPTTTGNVERGETTVEQPEKRTAVIDGVDVVASSTGTQTMASSTKQISATATGIERKRSAAADGEEKEYFAADEARRADTTIDGKVRKASITTSGIVNDAKNAVITVEGKVKEVRSVAKQDVAGTSREVSAEAGVIDGEVVLVTTIDGEDKGVYELDVARDYVIVSECNPGEEQHNSAETITIEDEISVEMECNVETQRNEDGTLDEATVSPLRLPAISTVLQRVANTSSPADSLGRYASGSPLESLEGIEVANLNFDADIQIMHMMDSDGDGEDGEDGEDVRLSEPKRTYETTSREEIITDGKPVNQPTMLPETGLPTTIETIPDKPTRQSALLPDRWWLYGHNIKGPRGRVFNINLPPIKDPRKHIQFRDPVFEHEAQKAHLEMAHSGKPRTGEGNDITPNPPLLLNFGEAIRDITKRIKVLTESSQKKERMKLSSRLARLKRRANHEANKIIFDGIQKEREKLSEIIADLKEEISCGDDSISLSCYYQQLTAQQPNPVAGMTAQYVDEVLEQAAS